MGESGRDGWQEAKMLAWDILLNGLESHLLTKALEGRNVVRKEGCFQLVRFRGLKIWGWS